LPQKIQKNIIESAVDYYKENNISIVKCSKKFNIGATTLTRYLHRYKINTSDYDLRKYTYNKDFFENIDTEEKAYWLGFIAADGCINSSLEISLSYKDNNHLYKFLEHLNGQREMISERWIKIRNNKYHVARLVVSSKKIISDLKKHGIYERKSCTLDFPKLNDKLLRHYLRGYFDGDGSISTNGKYRNGSPKYALNLIGSECFLEKFIFHMMNLGITRVSLQNRGPVKSWNKTGINQISIILNYFYNDASIYLDRKFQLSKEICRPNSTLQKK